MAGLSFRNITTAFRCDVLSFVPHPSGDRCCPNRFLEVVSSQETKEDSLRCLQDTCIAASHLKYRVTKVCSKVSLYSAQFRLIGEVESHISFVVSLRSPRHVFSIIYFHLLFCFSFIFCVENEYNKIFLHSRSHGVCNLNFDNLTDQNQDCTLQVFFQK